MMMTIHQDQKPFVLVRVVFLIAFLLFASQPAFALNFLKAKSFAESDSSRLILQELLQCEGDLEFCENIASIDLGPSPAPGKSTLVSVEEIRQIILLEIGAGDWQLSGPGNIRVTSRSVELNNDMVQEALQDLLNRSFSEASGIRAKVIGIIASSSQKLRPGSEIVDFPDLKNLKDADHVFLLQKITSLPSIRIKLKVPNEAGTELLVSFRPQIEIEQYGVSAATDIPSSSVIQASQLTKGWHKYSKMKGRFLTKLEEAIGRKARTSVSAGSPIALNQIELPALVQMGSVVDGLIRRGELRIHGKMKALGNGAEGSTIDVMNLANQRRMRARVVGNNKVEVL